jgi:hypothetical protein
VALIIDNVSLVNHSITRDHRSWIECLNLLHFSFPLSLQLLLLEEIF